MVWPELQSQIKSVKLSAVYLKAPNDVLLADNQSPNQGEIKESKMFT